MAQMKILILVRHAKSEWSNEHLPDLFRPLNPRGNMDAPKMATRIKSLGAHPDILICSPAVRAYSTALYFASAFSIPADAIQTYSQFYHTDAETYLKIFHKLNNEAQSCMAFGHNPMITELSNSMGKLRTDNVPTCGVLAWSFPCNKWNEIKPGTGTLLYYEYPKGQT